MGCSGPQFGMAFQEEKKEGDNEQKADDSRSISMMRPKKCSRPTVDYIETPAGSGLIVNNPNLRSSCGGSRAVATR